MVWVGRAELFLDGARCLAVPACLLSSLSTPPIRKAFDSKLEISVRAGLRSDWSFIFIQRTQNRNSGCFLGNCKKLSWSGCETSGQNFTWMNCSQTSQMCEAKKKLFFWCQLWYMLFLLLFYLSIVSSPDLFTLVDGWKCQVGVNPLVVTDTTAVNFFFSLPYIQVLSAPCGCLNSFLQNYIFSISTKLNLQAPFNNINATFFSISVVFFFSYSKSWETVK